MEDGLRTARLGYAILCDQAVSDTTGKNSFVGLFDRIYAPEFPGQHGRCFLGIEVRGIPGLHDLRLLVRDDAGKDLLPPIGPVKIQLSADYGGGTAVLHFDTFPLPKEGQYHLQVEVNGEILGERVLYVERQQRPGGARAS